MIKKVVVLSGSPRKGGNSERLCDEFMLGAKGKGIIYGTGAWAKGEIEGSLAMKQSYEMGKRL